MEHNLREKYCRIEQKAVSLRRKKKESYSVMKKRL